MALYHSKDTAWVKAALLEYEKARKAVAQVQQTRRSGEMVQTEELKTGKAGGSTELASEIFQAADQAGIKKVTEIWKVMMSDGKKQCDWELNILLLIYKWKGNPLNYGSY